MSFSAKNIPDDIKFLKVYENQTPADAEKDVNLLSSFIACHSYDTDNKSITPSTSLRVSNEVIIALNEFAPAKLLISTKSGSLILFHSFEFVKVYHQEGVNFISALPGFHEQQFPFLVTTSTKDVNLLNISNSYSEQLVDAGATSLFFDTPDATEGFTMHFATGDNVDVNHIWLGWVRMRFKSDFIDVLNRVGRLPLSQTK